MAGTVTVYTETQTENSGGGLDSSREAEITLPIADWYRLAQHLLQIAATDSAIAHAALNGGDPNALPFGMAGGVFAEG